jgi:hypothetical protein
MLLFMTTVGHVSTPSEAMMWLSANGWPFLWGQLLVPFLRAHAAANLYQPDPLMEKK